MTTLTRYSARTESLKLGVLLTALCLALIFSDALWRWDRLIYDMQSSTINRPASDDIVIIAVDENSLQQIGRWPWPREVHAQLINILSQSQVKATLIDMVFAEPSSTTNSDQQLANAIQNNAQVTLPVMMEQTRLRGQLIETLPLPPLTTAAASLGHVHVELDRDGIARGSFLYEGLGHARWPHITLALLQSIGNASEITPPADTNQGSAWSWVRHYPFLIPYIGAPGSYKTVSYASVLQDQDVRSSLKDKIVLVGVTAAGLGDSLPTPVSGLSHPMPGIEINANILQAIQEEALIQTIDALPFYIISAILVLTPILMFPYLSPRLSLILISSETIVIFFMSLLALKELHYWIPISAVIVTLLLSYPLWAWRRLEYTVKYLTTELETLTNEADDLQQFVAGESEISFEALQELVPVSGISVYNRENNAVLQQGKQCNHRIGQISTEQWTNMQDNVYGLKLYIGNTPHRLFIQWRYSSCPNKQQTKALKIYVRQNVIPIEEAAQSTVEIIESKIENIKKATDKLANLRQFITDSIDQMADGIVVTDRLGYITLINRQATNLLEDHVSSPLLHTSVLPALKRMNIVNAESWDNIIETLLEQKFYGNLQLSTESNHDLIVNINPMYTNKKSINGFIINLSDITELKNAQRRRNEMLSFLSHDLRSPLVSVLALLEQSKMGNEAMNYNNRIERNINHTIDLAEDFVHLSRIESDEAFQFTSTNLSDVISNAVDTIWEQAYKKQIDINQDLSYDCWVDGNGSILERVITNLLSNAIKYNNENGSIDIRLTTQEEFIECKICDTGPGIAEMDIPLLFDRFKRLKSTEKKQSGIGLGLAFVHAAITKHHGEITVQSQLGKGSCFIITLPTDQLDKS